MRDAVSGAIAGAAAGGVLALVMATGRRAGLLHETLAERAETWLDRHLNTRRQVGDAGTTALEQANHMFSAGVFGAAYGAVRRRWGRLPPVAAGSLLGGALYGINIVAIAPLIGLTRGEQEEPPSVAAQRLGMHLLFGIVTAVVADRLSRSGGRADQ